MNRIPVNIAIAAWLVAGFGIAPPATAQPAKPPASFRDQELTLVRPEMVSAKLIRNDMLIDKGTKEVKDLNGRGPVNRPIALGDLTVNGRREFPGFNGLQDLSNLSLTVYPDANAEAGIYYYLPTCYFLTWDDSNGYGMTVDYGVETTKKKNVILSARLSPGRLDEDRELIKALLVVYLSQQPQPPKHPIFQIRLVPLVVSYAPRFDWSNLEVEAADLKLSGVDPDTREMGFTLSCSVGTVALLVSKLGNPLGLEGGIDLTPQKVGDQPPLPATWIPARLRFAEDKAYCDTKWLRERGGAEFTKFRNRHPFPVRLKALCYLYKAGNALGIRGYDLRDQVLEPGQSAKIPNDRIHADIDGGNVVRAWYEYSLEARQELVDSLVDRLTGGVGKLPVQNVPIDVIGAPASLEQHQVNKVLIMVRSNYLDPKGTKAGEQRHEFTAQDVTTKSIRLYVPSTAQQPLFEWRIGLIMADGEQHVEPNWRPPPPLGQIAVGSKQLEEVLAK